MNEQRIGLPELSVDSIARIEDAVFERIADEPVKPAPLPAPHRSRRRWLTGAGIAAAFVVGVLITPPIMNSLSGTDMGADMIAVDESGADNAVSEEAVDAAAGDADGGAAQKAAPGASESLIAPSEVQTEREIITTGDATLRVENVAAAVKEIGELAAEHGGYVESSSISGSSESDAASAARADSAHGSISIRVPADDLDDVVGALDGSGEVLSASLHKEDVTSTAIDLRARVDALQASVERLTELMSKSGSVSALLEAEQALAQRQAELESYQQQLKTLDDQVAMSTLHIELVPQATTAEADPAGFADGLFAGWNGLIAAMNAVVIAFGFLLPWLVIVAVGLALVWLITRVRRRRRARRESAVDA